jgi:hypothetical protein
VAQRAGQGGPNGDIAALEAQTAALAVQLAEAQQSIAGLQELIIEQGSALEVMGGNFELHDDALFTLDAAGVRVNRVDAAVARTSILESYATELAGGDAGTPLNSAELETLLLPQDTTTGEVDAAVLGVILRIRKRPDLLLSEWDELIDESLEQIRENPLSQAAAKDAEVDVLAASHEELRDAHYHFFDRWQGEMGLLQADIDGNTAANQVTLQSVVHFVDDWQGEAGYLQAGIDANAAANQVTLQSVVHFVDDWQGEAAYLRTAVDGNTAANQVTVQSVAHFVDDWQGEAGYLRTAVDGNTAGVVELQASVDAVYEDVDALWGEVSRIDAATPLDSGPVDVEPCEGCGAEVSPPPSGTCEDGALEAVGGGLCGETDHF